MTNIKQRLLALETKKPTVYCNHIFLLCAPTTNELIYGEFRLKRRIGEKSSEFMSRYRTFLEEAEAGSPKKTILKFICVYGDD